MNRRGRRYLKDGARRYTVNGDRGILSGGPPAGEQPQVDNTLRYELTLAH